MDHEKKKASEHATRKRAGNQLQALFVFHEQKKCCKIKVKVRFWKIFDNSLVKYPISKRAS